MGLFLRCASVLWLSTISAQRRHSQAWPAPCCHSNSDLTLTLHHQLEVLAPVPLNDWKQGDAAPTDAGLSAPLVPACPLLNALPLLLLPRSPRCGSPQACVAFDYIASGPSAPSQPLCIPKSYVRPYLQPFGSGNVGALYKRQTQPSNVACEGSSLMLACTNGQLVNAITSAFYGRDDTTTCPIPGNPGASSYTGCAADGSTVKAIVEGRCLGKTSCDVPVNNGDMGGDPCGGTGKYLRVTYTCAPPPPPPPFQFYSVNGYQPPLVNQDSPGNDISFNYVDTIEQCAALCDANSGCVAFDYIASGPSAPTRPLCIPKHALRPYYQAFGSGNIGALYVKSAPPPAGTVQSTQVECEGGQMSIACAGGAVSSIDAAFYGRSDTSTCPHPVWGAMQFTGCAANAAGIKSIVEARCLGQGACTVPVNNYDMGGDPCGGTYKWLSVTFTCTP
eukprot:364662-Chlamydomonas_euryale.AAC.5